ncbi:hypothetical protein BC829DRAFT_404768, partial [Chytridium lagenaria]
MMKVKRDGADASSTSQVPPPPTGPPLPMSRHTNGIELSTVPHWTQGIGSTSYEAFPPRNVTRVDLPPPYASGLVDTEAGSTKAWSTSSGEMACPVCLEDFADGEYVRELPCGHIFHPSVRVL